MMNHTAKPRAKGKNSINFYTLFWLFMIGSLVGFIVEGVWAVIKTGHWGTSCSYFVGGRFVSSMG